MLPRFISPILLFRLPALTCEFLLFLLFLKEPSAYLLHWLNCAKSFESLWTILEGTTFISPFFLVTANGSFLIANICYTYPSSCCLILFHLLFFYYRIAKYFSALAISGTSSFPSRNLTSLQKNFCACALMWTASLVCKYASILSQSLPCTSSASKNILCSSSVHRPVL